MSIMEYEERRTNIKWFKIIFTVFYLESCPISVAIL